jgi:hypothetical protein
MMRGLMEVAHELADAVCCQAKDGLDRTEFIRKRAAEFLKMQGQRGTCGFCKQPLDGGPHCSNCGDAVTPCTARLSLGM